MNVKHFFCVVTLVLTMFGSGRVYAQRNYLKPVELTINSENGVFAKGDTVKVYARLLSDAPSSYVMNVYENAGPRHYKSYSKDCESVGLTLTGESQLVLCKAYDKAVTVMLEVVPSEGPRDKRAMVGFGVAPEEFRPGYEEPADFVSYWDAQKARLRKSRMKVRKTEVEISNAEDAEKYVAYAIEISMPEGNPVRGYMAMPRNAGKKSLPICLFVHSAGVARPGCRSSVGTALKYAKCGNGAIGVDINAHGMLNGQPQEYYNDLERHELKGYSTRPLSDRDSYFTRLMYLRELRTMDYLCKLTEWDGKRALVYGESQGGGQAEALAGLDSRITAVVANVPAMTDYGAPLQDRQIGWPTGYGRPSNEALAREILPYFDGAIFLQHTDAKLFMVSGWIDETCHSSGIHAAFNASSSPDKVIFDFPYRWHSGTNKPFDKVWNSTVGKARTAFINEHLK